MWDWRIRDFEGCYDALRVHMGVVPQEFGCNAWNCALPTRSLK